MNNNRKQDLIRRGYFKKQRTIVKLFVNYEFNQGLEIKRGNFQKQNTDYELSVFNQLKDAKQKCDNILTFNFRLNELITIFGQCVKFCQFSIGGWSH